MFRVTRRGLSVVATIAMAVCLGINAWAAAPASDTPKAAKPAPAAGTPKTATPAPAADHAEPASGTRQEGGAPKPSGTPRRTEAAARDVVQRIEAVMSTAAQRKKAAAPPAKTIKPRGDRPSPPHDGRPTRLLEWRDERSPGGVTLDWGDLQPPQPPIGVRLVWPAFTSSS